MIESIKNNEQEKPSAEKSNPLFRMPKNVRQIGLIEGNKKIYVEDYVMTYIRQLPAKNTGKYQIAVLLGKFARIDDNKNIFINGAIEVKNLSFEENMIFTHEAWTSIYDEVKRYFPELEIVGWYLTKPGLNMEVDDKLKKVHIDNFAGQDKTLLMYDCLEREEAFYLFIGNSLNKQTGYYIYYEKNEEMQSYMIAQKENVSEELQYEDRAVKEIRKIIAAKKEVPQEKRLVRLFYGASTVLAAVVLVIGVTMLNNYDKINTMERTLHDISKNLSVKSEPQNTPQDSNIGTKKTEVETMAGDVKIKKENASKETAVTNKNESKEKSEPKESAQKPVKAEAKKTQNGSKKVPVKKYYVVKKGDTLASISYKVYKSTARISAIQKANNIQNQDKIYAGEKLLLP
jgi:Uncharacterized protein containing LysM domain